jgi:hypothetical protein
MKYCRINLSSTNYTCLPSAEWAYQVTFDKLPSIYKKYCDYKKFSSVMPLFEDQFSDANTNVIGYYDSNNLVAFSIVKIHDIKNVEAVQFAWDYANPKLRLGIESLKHECAVYRDRGFKYLYLGEAAEYKSQIDGFEILGKL